MTTPPTTAELRAAWHRARLLRFRGWTFERALQAPLIRWSLERSALAHRCADQPLQPRLFT